ncbi:Polyketide cyclase / dehydrase and lipid transport [Streptomyces sp. S4.7]|uniref:SRPBCC family protein n=1 Tax=Streptomyces sp. S4.7 TaxID=2705439 RepID=UPI001398C6BB|nr:SRPBCC family protein [Streptomyces sp. S4.7]QHY99720.1 Polyketide cyclase / dehydrase and lipid transport [Streptomyces sp. S4.7]
MAVRHRLIERPVADVWAVLADGSRYGDWVVGTSDSRPQEGAWPEVGSGITYTIRLGRCAVSGSTVVRRCEEPGVLELEADSGRLGTARIAVEVRPWGENALVIIDEHPLRGPGGLLHNTAVDALIQLRHRTMLARLADVVENAPSPARAAA